MSKSKTVWLKEDWKGHFKGSCLHVDKETKNYYYGIHASMAGSYYMKFDKTKCTKTDPQEYINKIVKKAKKTKAYIELTKLFNERK